MHNVITTLLAVALLGCSSFAGYNSDVRTVGVSVSIGAETTAPGVAGGEISQMGGGVIMSVACTLANVALGLQGRDPVCAEETDEPDETEEDDS